MMESAEVRILENRLWAVAKGRAFPYGFASNCEILVKEFIHRGAERLVAEGHADDEDKIVLAEANLSAYILEMTIEAARLGYTELHEDTEGHARSTVCPLWPFC